MTAIDDKVLDKEKLLDECIWKVMSKDPNSTTFQQVTKDTPESPLYACKYTCSGYSVKMGCYKPIRFFKDSEYYKELTDNYTTSERVGNMLNNRPSRDW